MKKSIYIKLFFLTVISSFGLAFGQGTWERITSPTDDNLRSIYFADSLYGWAVGDSGTIIHTSNGGIDWNFQESNTLNSIVDVFFLDRETGWAISWNLTTQPFGTIILSTTNGGSSWQSDEYRDEYILMSTILFFDTLTGWMVGNPHSIVKTTDGGLNWEQAYVDTVPLAFFPVISIGFYNEKYGYACGGQYDIAGVAWSTSDSGTSWQTITPPEAPPDPIQEIHIIDSLNVIGLSGDIEGLYDIDVIRTSNGGVSWEYESIPFRGVPIDLDFRSDTEVWAPIPSSNEFIVSTDAGVTWEQCVTPDTTSIVDVMFTDSLHGFSVGSDGVILKYKPPIIVNSVKEEIISINKFHLEQNYPNPFNPVTTIRFTIPELQYTTLKVYDILGNVVSTLINEYKPAGTYEIDFNFTLGQQNPVSGIQHPASGIYFYQLKSGMFIEARKMLLLK